MTQIDKEAVERYTLDDNGGMMLRSYGEWVHYSEYRAVLDAAKAEKRAIEASFEPVLHWYQSDEEHMRPIEDRVADAVADLQEDRAENIKSKAEKRAAVAAVCKTAAQIGKSAAYLYSDPTDAILALADTDALAEYTEKVRAEERERCLNLVPDGSDEWYENLRPVHVKRMLAVLRAAIRQETNDA
jgi:hypothetical protein